MEDLIKQAEGLPHWMEWEDPNDFHVIPPEGGECSWETVEPSVFRLFFRDIREVAYAIVVKSSYGMALVLSWRDHMMVLPSSDFSLLTSGSRLRELFSSGALLET